MWPPDPRLTTGVQGCKNRFKRLLSRGHTEYLIVLKSKKKVGFRVTLGLSVLFCSTHECCSVCDAFLPVWLKWINRSKLADSSNKDVGFMKIYYMNWYNSQTSLIHSLVPTRGLAMIWKLPVVIQVALENCLLYLSFRSSEPRMIWTPVEFFAVGKTHEILQI